jgi:hypothetical protein
MSKVQELRKLSYRRWHSRWGGIPFLAIQGKFLERYNFKYQDMVLVHYAKNLITITKAPKVMGPERTKR